MSQIDYDKVFAWNVAYRLARERSKRGQLTPQQEQQIINQVTRDFAAWRATHLERRVCTKASPMPMADKDKYQWGHPDAVEVTDPPHPFANVIPYHCPHCGLTFVVPREP